MSQDHSHQLLGLDRSGYIVLNTSSSLTQKEQVRQVVDNMPDDWSHGGGKGERLNHPGSRGWKWYQGLRGQ